MPQEITPQPDPTASAPASTEKKTTDIHLELTPAITDPTLKGDALSAAGAVAAGKWSVLREDAIAAEEAERNLSVKDSLRLYPRAVFWSFSISLCIIMEGMDLGRELACFFSSSVRRDK